MVARHPTGFNLGQLIYGGSTGAEPANTPLVSSM